jgi:hypothetical protein
MIEAQAFKWHAARFRSSPTTSWGLLELVVVVNSEAQAVATTHDAHAQLLLRYSNHTIEISKRGQMPIPAAYDA